VPNKPDKIQPKILIYRHKLPNGGYTEFQLNERIRGNQVAVEFGFPNETLQNWRASSRECGEIVGIPHFQDGDVNFYIRREVIEYVEEHTFRKKKSDTSDSSDSSCQDTNVYKIKDKKNKHPS
tara:strand:+ start:248 stop:616 length:369 start_codon:yes stop_codon:yes gene_type:complete